MSPQDAARFREIETWVFDLDNTLYPVECDLFSQVDQRMGEFIADFLAVDFAEARRVQKDYYRTFGTTLHGLMHRHGVDPHAFLDYVHDIDLSPLTHDAGLARAIGALPGRKYILTNGSRAHAERVAGKLGVLEQFDDVFDIAAGGYMPKPDRAIYERFLERFTVRPEQAAIFEDLSRNLEMPSVLGMATILVTPAACAHPDDREGWAPQDREAPHVDHVTDDLKRFLLEILKGLGLAPARG
jgi:putative hydrolase of the HAD superfamily